MKKKLIFSVLYLNVFFVEKNWQNDVIRLSTFCQNAVFSNMSVHPWVGFKTAEDGRAEIL
jgi:hypothetical protein